MTEARHYTDTICLSLQRKETAYNTPVGMWDSSTATLMRDFTDAAAHELWDDQIVGDTLIAQGQTSPAVQAMAQSSVRLLYQEPRVKLHSLTGLLAVSLGQSVSTSLAPLAGYRHALSLAAPTAVPSISAMTGHQQQGYYVYGGLKSEGWTLSLSQANPYLSFVCPLLGAGSRLAVTPSSFPPPIVEPWLALGDCHLYLADVTDAPLFVTPLPVQGTTNLGAGAAEFSSRVLALTLQQQNALGSAAAYSVDSGRERAQCYAASQTFQVTLTLEVKTATEAAELAWYLTQRQLAVELQCVPPTVIDPVIFTPLTVGTPPSAHRVTDAGGGTWYLWVTTGGELILAASAPAGTALTVGLGLQFLTLDGYRYRLGADALQEGMATQMAFVGLTPHTIEYCALLDSVGTPWYVWMSPGGEMVVSPTVVPLVPARTGIILLCPRVQWKALVRQEQQQNDTLQLTGTVLDDGVNGAFRAWAFNTQPAYVQ